MDDKQFLDNYESAVAEAIYSHLLQVEEVDPIKLDAPDLEDAWAGIGEQYIPDGVREFGNYPTVSLGWVMFVGMAMAQYWDKDWERYGAEKDIYIRLRDARGYDYMDEYICEKVLKLGASDAKSTSNLVADVAEIAQSVLQKQGFEPSTPMAFYGYTRTLRQMYKAGYAVQLKRLGYHMEKL